MCGWNLTKFDSPGCQLPFYVLVLDFYHITPYTNSIGQSDNTLVSVQGPSCAGCFQKLVNLSFFFNPVVAVAAADAIL